MVVFVRLRSGGTPVARRTTRHGWLCFSSSSSLPGINLGLWRVVLIVDTYSTPIDEQVTLEHA